MNLNPISQEWRCRHAFFDIVVGSFTAVFATAVIFSYVPPAWAISVPVGNLFVVDLGDLPPWIGALVALAIWWDARKAKKNAAAAVQAAVGIKTDLVKVQDDVKLIERNTNSLTQQIKASARKDGVAEGAAAEKIVGEAAAEQLAEGQRQGRADERASVAASNPSPVHAATGVEAGKQPLPVADDRTGAASDRVAEATERLAAATEVKVNKETKPGD